MVTPRLSFIRQFDRALAGQRGRISGMVQRGVVVGVNTLYAPAICDVQVELRNGATARVPNALTLSSSYDPMVPPSVPQVGQRVLLLCPTGRAADLCFILGLAASGMIILSNLANTNGGARRVALSAPFVTRVEIPAIGTARELRIDGFQVAVAGGANAVPAITVNGATTYRPGARLADVPSGGPSQAGVGLTLPKITFHGAYTLAIPAGQTGTLDLAFEGRERGVGPSWEWWAHVTASADQTPAPADAGAMLASAPPYPLMALFGALG